MKILLTGGSGTLGKELIKLLAKTQHKIYYPSSSELDISDYNSCINAFDKYQPDLVINSAAYTDVKASENNVNKSIKTNIIGTCNIVLACERNNIRLAHISTDHVFDGEKGNYEVGDPINPITKYAKSKGSAELCARMYNNALIIRTSFFTHTFPYEKAFIDQWSSKDYVDIIAPKVLEAALSDKLGIVHCVSERRTLFDIARDRKPEVEGISRNDINFPTPKDTSLI
jgi:dTDP-4-dehydrorhamnose reductase